jgi:hypothetical protein
MSGWDDLEGVTSPRISEDDTELVLSGASFAGELNGLDAVLAALRAPAEPGELAGLDPVLVAFGVAVVTTPSISDARTRPMFKKLLTSKTLATIGVVTFVSAGVAAASGVVPAPFEASKPLAASTTIAVVDDPIDSTDESDDTVGNHSETSTATQSSVAEVQVDPASLAVAEEEVANTELQGPDVNGPAKFGLCTAYEARTKHDDITTTDDGVGSAADPVVADPASALPVPFQALSDAALAAGQTVAEFCAEAQPGHSADAPGQSADNPSETAPGKSEDKPSATAPGKSDDKPSATAPGKSDDKPSATAPGRSGGNPSDNHNEPAHP